MPTLNEVPNVSDLNRKHQHRTGLFFSLCVVSAITVFILVSLFFEPIASPVQGTLSALMNPKELANARFAPASFATASASIYTDAGAAYTKKTYDGHIVGFAQGVTDGVITQGSDGIYYVFAGEEMLASSAQPVIGASVSPSEQAVAISRTVEGKAGSRATNDFEVVIIAPATGHETVVGKGFAPIFTDDSHLIYFAPVGIYMFDLAAGSTTLLVKHTFRNVVSSATYSPDYALAAWSDLSGTDTVVYRLGTGEKIASYPQSLPLIALGNDALYSLDTVWWGTVVDVHLFSGSSHSLHWLPKYYQIRKLAL